MDTASQNLPHHLRVLRKRLEHPTDYELALTYFLERFAGDDAFHKQCQPESAPHLFALLTRVSVRAFGKPVTLEQFRAFRLPKFGFHHGAATVEDRAVVFLFFDNLDCGLMALIPGVTGAMEVARFRLAGSQEGELANN